MRKYRYITTSLLLILLVVCFNQCKKNDSVKPKNEVEQEPSMDMDTRQGVLKISDESTIQIDDLEVISFGGASSIDNEGNFSVEANVADKYQLLFFNSKSNNEPVYIGLYDPVKEEVMANDTSTALSLTLFNPYLIYTDQHQKESYLQAVKSNPKFLELVSALNTSYANDANLALDYESNKEVFQLVCQLMKEALIELGGENGLKSASALGEAPNIKDVTGPDIAFVNPRHVYYAADIQTSGGQSKDVVTVFRKDNLVSTELAWPPLVWTEAEETNYKLGDGTYTIHITKELDFTKIGKWDHPVGRATITNTAQMAIYLVDLIIGNSKFFSEEMVVSFPNHFHISADRSYAFGKAIGARDVEGFLMEFFGCVADNAEELAYWIWQSNQSNAAHKFLSTGAAIFKNVTFALKLLGYANEQGPFVWDLIFAPKEVTYNITQSGGVITDNDKNTQPEAMFVITPPSGIVTTQFQFDASLSTDDNTSVENLLFRWDWESDGVWDTDWSSSAIQQKTYEEKGAYTISLEVKDEGGLVGLYTKKLSVGGGAGTANHIKLFQDNKPWSSNAAINVLQSLGFTEGTGENEYEIIPSSQMADVELFPGVDLVIIANDQSQTFYNNYAKSQIKFVDFAYNGGSIFWEACDKGWAKGSIEAAGINFPGNIGIKFDYDRINYVANEHLPLVEGMPQKLDHNYASHESFYNLPDGTTVYTNNESQEPTLIEYNFGSGWVIMTAQPLEHQYDRIYNNPDMEVLLPRIISYFTGKPMLKSLRVPNQVNDQRSSLGVDY